LHGTIGMKLQQTIRREVSVKKTPRFVQICGKFDLPVEPTSIREWAAEIELPAEWSVGVITGPSMAGKNTIADELFPGELVEQGFWPWPDDKCIGDGFPAGMSIDEITGLLSSVGFSSPPDWQKPYKALSNGGKFRVDLARTLAERPQRAVIDEFGSLVHATARQVAAAAAAKAVRRRGGQLVALLVHDDAVEHFEPDWVIRIRPGEKVTADVTRGLVRRPPCQLKIVRVDPSAWQLFRHHHYLDHDLNRNAKCFVAMVGDGSAAKRAVGPTEGGGRQRGETTAQGENPVPEAGACQAWTPAAFVAVLPFPHATAPGWREHRTVCLPDYQGIGIGNAVSEFIASLYVATGRPYYSTTCHPAMMRHRARSALWTMTRKPSLGKPHKAASVPWMAATNSCTRLSASFRYVGPARPAEAKGFGLV
jgi:hypothetical protein